MECRKTVSREPTNPLKLDFRYLLLISLASSSGSSVLVYAPYLCLSLIFLLYCLTHVECFCFFLVANILAAPINFRQRAQTAQYRQRLWRLCPPYCERKVGFLGHVTHVIIIIIIIIKNVKIRVTLS